MKQRGRITIVRPSRHLLLLFVSLLLILSFGCDLNFQFPTIPSFKRPPRKSDLLADLNSQLATIWEATITLKGDDIVFYFDGPIDTENLKTTIQSVFTKLTHISESWSITIGDETRTTSLGAAEAMIRCIDEFDHAWQEEVGYSAQVTYKGQPFELRGEFVFQDIFMKLLSIEELAEFHVQAFLAVHQPTLDLEEVSFDNAIAVLRALADFEKLSEDAKGLLEEEKDLLDNLLSTIRSNATAEELQILDSLLSAQTEFRISIPFSHIDQLEAELRSQTEIMELQQSYTIEFYNKLGVAETFDHFDDASTYIVYLEATPKEGLTLTPISGNVIIKIGSVSIGSDSDTLYTIEDAIEFADNDDIVVRYNTSFASAEVAEQVYGKTTYRIGSPTTLVLPYDETLSSGINDIPKELDQEGNVIHVTAGSIARSGGYVRLTVPEDITIDLKGRLVVNAKRAAYATKFQGHVTGTNYSVLNLEKDSKINVEYRGELYALGFIEGEGEIEVESGGYVYEGMFISSFRGGTATSRIEEDVFPFDQFTVMQIESPLIINGGGNYIAKALVWVSSKYRSGDFALVGPSALFRLNDANGTTLDKSFDRDTGHVTLTFNGNGSINNGSVKVGSISASTSGRAIPFDGTWHFVVSTGSTLDIDAKAALLPGSSLTVESGAVVVVKEGTDEERGRNELTIFNAENIPYPEDYNDYPNETIEKYYRNPPVLGYSSSSGAEVINSGTIIVEKNSGIAGSVTNHGGTVTRDDDAITEYEYYIVTGSAGEAEVDTITVTYVE